MKSIRPVLAVTAIAITFAFAEEKKPVNGSNEVAVIKTSEGEMVVQFWNDAAPETIANFKKLARAGFYEGTAFHRFVKRFMIQGADPNTTEPAKETSYGARTSSYWARAELNGY